MSEPCNCDQALKLQAKVDQLIRSADSHYFNSPDLYELVDDIIEDFFNK